MPSTASHAEAPRSELALSSKRHTIYDSEEERLLGATRGKNDAGAVHIGMPQTRVSAVKIHNGGPRPSNTLNGNPQGTRANQAARSGPRRGFQKELQIMPSRGSNVIGMPHAIGVDENFALSSAKRQKTKHQPSSRTSSSSMDDALDNMPPESVNFGPPSQSQNGSRAPSAHSQGSGPSLQMGRSASSNGSLQEYKRVESLMSSDPRSTKRQRRRNSQNQQHNHDLPAPSMFFNPIDISGGDEMVMNSKPTTAPRVPHQGTMRKPHSTVSAPNTSKLLQDPSTRKQSPFFSQSSHIIDKMKQKAKSINGWG
ncbi:hypothetical protein ABVK25_006476 [Lepraria finkii]|uniref:Uncharacterized protein n=1 Tax=Lepraria finkii TaxID=1340010 RepID=A0ABR4B5M2_9LECA